MANKLKDLLEKRAKAVSDARAILDKAGAENRGLSAEDKETYNKFDKDIEDIGVLIEAEEKLARHEKLIGSEVRKIETTSTNSKEEVDPHKRAFRNYLLRGAGAVSSEERALYQSSQQDGGFTVPQQTFVNQLIKFIDDQVVFRQFATTFMIEKAESLGIPTLEADPADADWTSELATGSEDSSMKFGKREFATSPVAKRIKISNKLLQSSVMDIEGLVLQRLGYKFGVTQEKAFMTGTGASQPLGVYTASANGIPTSRDVSTGNTATAPTFDGLINALYSIKEGYHSKLKWLFHRLVLAEIRKLKDLNNQYLWQPAVVAGEPERILNIPVVKSEYSPSTLTASQYVGLLGDFSQYYIVDAANMTVQKLTELYAETNQVGFIGRMESDGMPVMAEAFARVKLAAS